MHNDFPRFIKQCRINAQLTQETAAIELNIPRRSLVNYENGTTFVPDDIAVAMSKLYQVPIIRYLWLKNTLCGQCLLDFEEKNLSESILGLAVKLNESNSHLNDLMLIGSDGRIDTNEKPKYTLILDTFRQLAKDILSLNFCSIKKAESRERFSR